MRRRLSQRLLGALAAGAFLATGAAAQDPYTEPDDSWISIDGSVEAVMPNAFTLDYGDGLITVEMDDGDRDADAYQLVEGDMVSVTGVVDDELFESTTIEASSVYVENLGTYFFSSAVDEEDNFVTLTTPLALSRMVLQGTVTDVSKGAFTLNTGVRDITVEVEEMPYDPLDDEGYQQIEVGDYVSVTGQMDYDFIDGQELAATAITTLVG